MRKSAAAALSVAIGSLPWMVYGVHRTASDLSTFAWTGLFIFVPLYMGMSFVAVGLCVWLAFKKSRIALLGLIPTIAFWIRLFWGGLS